MNTRERDEFVAIMAQEGVSVDTARKLMRASSTLHRLAEATCNGDWPADNGERIVAPCSRCEGLWVPSTLLKGKLCPDCRTEDRVRALCEPLGIKPSFGGDPRGVALVLAMPSGRSNDYERSGVVVPR